MPPRRHMLERLNQAVTRYGSHNRFHMFELFLGIVIAVGVVVLWQAWYQGALSR